MSVKELLKQKDDEADKVAADFETFKLSKLDEIQQAEAVRDEKIAKLRAERNEIAMKEKLKAYPKTLVKEHTHCSICGAEMRPFAVMEGEVRVNYWGGQVGGLLDSHDLVRV